MTIPNIATAELWLFYEEKNYDLIVKIAAHTKSGL